MHARKVIRWIHEITSSPYDLCLPVKTTSSLLLVISLAGFAAPASAQEEWEERIVSGTYADVLRIVVADFDGNGGQDILVGSGGPGFGDTLSLLENMNGTGAFTTPLTIWDEATTIGGLGAVDIDGDGWLDILLGESVLSTVLWFRNRGAGFGFGGPRTISTEVNAVGSLSPADLDADGDIDLIASTPATNLVSLLRHSNGTGTFDSPETLFLDLSAPDELSTGDLDGDGDLDIVVTSISDPRAVWYPNADGLGGLGSSLTITSAHDLAAGMLLVDLDSDGDLDVVGGESFEDEVAWYENEDGLGTFGAAQTIDSQAGSMSGLALPDIDLDGDIDVVWGSDDRMQILWAEHVDGQGTFGLTRVAGPVTSGSIRIACADFDGDLDVDLLPRNVKSSVLEWLPNADGAGTFGVPVRLSPGSTEAPVDAVAADFDGDGTLDLASISDGDDQLAWYPNSAGAGDFATQIVLGSPGAQPNALVAGDVNGDGAVDLLAMTVSGDIVWYDNIDGAGQLVGPIALPAAQDTPENCDLADLDGDGDLDVVVVSSGDDTTGWYENRDGLGDFGPLAIITASSNNSKALTIGDIDGDGDLDVFSSDLDAFTISWQENVDGSATVWSEHSFPTAQLRGFEMQAADVDGDGDLDLVAGIFDQSVGISQMAWFENLDGIGTFSAPIRIGPTGEIPDDLDVFDYDADGDMDVLATADDDDAFVLYENFDGSGTDWFPIFLNSKAFSPTSVTSADLDGNGTPDVVGTSRADDQLSWFVSPLCTTDPVAAFSADVQFGSAPLTVAFTNDSVGTQLSSRRWDFGNGRSSVASNPVTVYTTPGTYDVQLTVTGALGTCTQFKRAFVQVVGCDPATATERNGSGMNEKTLTSLSNPIVGSTWNVQLDASGHAAGLAVLVVYQAASAGLFIAGGEILVDLSSPFLGSVSDTHSGVPIDLSIAIPNDLALCSMTASAQGIALGAPGYELSNAFDLVFGQ